MFSYGHGLKMLHTTAKEFGNYGSIGETYNAKQIYNFSFVYYHIVLLQDTTIPCKYYDTVTKSIHHKLPNKCVRAYVTSYICAQMPLCRRMQSVHGLSFVHVPPYVQVSEREGVLVCVRLGKCCRSVRNCRNQCGLNVDRKITTVSGRLCLCQYLSERE